MKKGKAVATVTGSNSNSNTNGRLRRDGSSRPSRSRGLNASHIPSQSTSSAAVAAAVRVGASSPLSLPGSSNSRGQGSRHRREDGISSEDDEDETRDGAEDDEEEEEEEELSPIMTPQATGFDRLREAGFSEDEIQSIRRQFHASRGTVTSTVGENGIAVGLDQDEDASARARRIEEEWIDQHGAETLPEGRKLLLFIVDCSFLFLECGNVACAHMFGGERRDMIFVDQGYVCMIKMILK